VGLAYESLASDGWVETHVGRGTFVSGPVSSSPIDPPLSPLVSRLLDHSESRTPHAVPSDTIAFHALVPDPELFPVDAFRRSLNDALATGGADLLGYGDGGEAGLREVIAAHLADHGIAAEPDSVVTCQGASQGLSLVARAFAAPGDAIAVEEPTYQGALGILIGVGLRPEPVPTHAAGAEPGVDLEALERVLAQPSVKAFYTMPTFHNPLGITTGCEHRRRLLAIALAAGKPVVEDACAIDLRFRGRSVPPLAALDDSGLVLPLFSFSKSLFPGVRCGAVLARGRSLEALRVLKRATDLGDARTLQAAVASFVRSGHYRRHLQQWRRTLAVRCDAMLEALHEHLPPDLHWVAPEGGYQIWVELPRDLDAREVHAAALRAGVLIAPGDQFHVAGRRARGFRLVYAQSAPKEIREGIVRLAGVIDQLRAASVAAKGRAVNAGGTRG
jgi:DNA-binding transcriptional MocR family regulator